MRLTEPLEEKIIPALFGGLAIFLVMFIMHRSVGTAIIIASLGASTVILAEYPDTRAARLRVVVSAYALAAVSGYLFSLLAFVPLAAGLAVFCTISAMLLLDVVHAPAGGVALAFVMYGSELRHLAYVMAAVLLLLTFLKSLIYLYKKELHLKKFHHEFLK